MRKKKDLFFVLDVGTRKVTGLLAENEKGTIKIKHIYMEEHANRVMLDGQIHDIPQVAGIIEKVKKVIEAKEGVKIKKAFVAAAGRSLKTINKQIIKKRGSLLEITEDEVHSLEYEALYAAQEDLQKKQVQEKKMPDFDYHCVGYSVQSYVLDDSEIGNLVGQKGQRIGVRIIATFLPRVVVDSLRVALKRAKLKMEGLTLEPIAALNIVVPPDMRQLNLALVDIGAGTSDIAITSEGRIHSYDMVPVAGDEITEILCNELLLDFTTAETVKRSLSLKEKISFTDILGSEQTLQSKEIVNIILPGIEDLADKIAQGILAHNVTSPQAVFCVGGGSLTPEIVELLREKLNLTPGRVALKGKDMLNMLPPEVSGFQGPDLVTPVGIAFSAHNRDSLRFATVFVNEEEVSVVDMQKLTVLDVLLSAGMLPSTLYGRPGDGITIEINGTVKAIPGERGKMARVFIKDKEVSMDSPVSDGARIKFIPAIKGSRAKKTVKEVLPNMFYRDVSVNSTSYRLPPFIRINGKLAVEDSILKDKDKLELTPCTKVKDIIDLLELNPQVKGQVVEEYFFTLNNAKRFFAAPAFSLLLNGKTTELYSSISNGDRLEIKEGAPSVRVRDLLGEVSSEEMQVIVNGKKIEFPDQSVEVLINGSVGTVDTAVILGDEVTVNLKKNSLIIADILKEIAFDKVTPPPNSKLVLRINEAEAQFTSQVSNGDSLEILWAGQSKLLS